MCIFSFSPVAQSCPTLRPHALQDTYQFPGHSSLWREKEGNKIVGVSVIFLKRAEIILWNDCICKMKVVSTQVLLCAILFYKLKIFQFFFFFFNEVRFSFSSSAHRYLKVFLAHKTEMELNDCQPESKGKEMEGAEQSLPGTEVQGPGPSGREF